MVDRTAAWNVGSPMASGAKNRGGWNRGSLRRGQEPDRRAARSVGEAEAAFSIEEARLVFTCPMNRAQVCQSSARKSCVGGQIFQSREQRHGGVNPASATMGTS